MMRIIEAAQISVLSVAGQGILGQVIRAAGEEVYDLRKTVTHEHCSGGLDHDSDLDVI